MDNLMDKITHDKLDRYFSMTEKALSEVKKNIAKRKQKQAREIIEMTENYLSDAKHFYSKNNLTNAFAALNYAHGWLDCGVRLGIFDVKNRDLFTIK